MEISADHGATWETAEVKPALGPYTWVLWRTRWSPPQARGYTLRVRATDSSGGAQPGAETPTYPDDASGYHHIVIRFTGA